MEEKIAEHLRRGKMSFADDSPIILPLFAPHISWFLPIYNRNETDNNNTAIKFHLKQPRQQLKAKQAAIFQENISSFHRHIERNQLVFF